MQHCCLYNIPEASTHTHNHAHLPVLGLLTNTYVIIKHLDSYSYSHILWILVLIFINPVLASALIKMLVIVIFSTMYVLLALSEDSTQQRFSSQEAFHYGTRWPSWFLASVAPWSSSSHTSLSICSSDQTSHKHLINPHPPPHPQAWPGESHQL